MVVLWLVDYGVGKMLQKWRELLVNGSRHLRHTLCNRRLQARCNSGADAAGEKADVEHAHMAIHIAAANRLPPSLILILKKNEREYAEYFYVC